MQKIPEQQKSYNKNESAFDYTLILKPDGTVKIKDKRGKSIKCEVKKKHPRIKKILNTRTLTVIEAEGSQWIYLAPPGRWYRL